MILNPSHYECPDDHADITALVEQVLEELGPPVAYRRPPGPKPFQVIVTCPGASGAGSHSVTVTGTQTP
jgi:hypothetical protein